MAENEATIVVKAEDLFFIIGGLKQLKQNWDIAPLQELGASETMLENSRFVTENCDRLIAELRAAEDKAWGF